MQYPSTVLEVVEVMLDKCVTGVRWWQELLHMMKYILGVRMNSEVPVRTMYTRRHLVQGA